ncbi:MAG: DNA polymerase/3'-5' exonuclease PolX [Phycisphaeraceae bacterium]
MSRTNAELAGILQEMADLHEILGANRFKVIAFAKAARVAGDHGSALAGMSEKELLGIDGIGKGVAGRIVEWSETGRIEDLEALRAKVPAGLPGLLEVSGLGPKTVVLLWKEAGVESVVDLKAALEDETKSEAIAAIKGLGKKKLEGVRKSLAFLERSVGRVRLGQAMVLAEVVLDKVRDFEGVEEALSAGSLRRGKETIGDIDILVRTDRNEELRKAMAAAFVGLPGVTEVLGEGATKCSVRMRLGDRSPEMQVDLRMVPSGGYGAALMYFTGSKEHNVSLRERAQEQGLSLNEYGLWRGKAPKQGMGDGDQLVAGETEAAVYAALGLAWIPPELREDRGELERAEGAFSTKGKKTAEHRLIEVEDVVADLHTHTTASDGSLSIDKMAEAAIARGLKVLAITDHSKSQVQANGLSAERLLEHVAAVRAADKKMKGKIRLLAGSEVDILADGSLDYPDEVLAELDVVVASPHAALSQPPEEATRRLIRAIENPHVKIIGHPTGRLINRREGLSPDMGKVIAAAKQHGVALEINANDWRLDLRDVHAKMAVEAGVALSINTDAHDAEGFEHLRYGVLTARRAGAQKGDVVNCWGVKKLLGWLSA